LEILDYWIHSFAADAATPFLTIASQGQENNATVPFVSFLRLIVLAFDPAMIAVLTIPANGHILAVGGQRVSNYRIVEKLGGCEPSTGRSPI